MITVSAAEFTATVTKACLGAGIERGIAEEIGPACVELALRDLPSLVPLLDALGRSADTGSSNRWVRTQNGWITDHVTSLSDAVSLVDFASIAGSDGARTETIARPVICIGLALHRARYSDWMAEAAFGAGDWLDFEANSNTFDKHMNDAAFALRFRHADREFQRPDISAIEIPRKDWQSLDLWTSKTLVPADETSRSDAGAGNTDND